MKKLLLIITALLFLSCSDNNEKETEQIQQFQELNLNIVALEQVTFYKQNNEGQQLPITIGEPVTVFDETTFIQIKKNVINTNNIIGSDYYKQGNKYSLENNITILFYENTNILLITTKVLTDYGYYERKELYTYGTT